MTEPILKMNMKTKPVSYEVWEGENLIFSGTHGTAVAVLEARSEYWKRLKARQLTGEKTA